MSPILINSRIFVPEAEIDAARLSHYEISLYKESVCARCPVYKEGLRHSDADCEPCAAYQGTMQLWRQTKHKGINYIALPPGRPRHLERVFNIDLTQARDLRPELPFTHSIKFTGELYRGQKIRDRQTVDQVAMVANWLKRKGGIIEVPPRGGKTVIGAYIACEIGMKTVIVAHERQLLKQFRNTFRGNRKYPAFTNAKKLERRAGVPVVKIIDKMSDFTPDVDIALVNYQKFIRNKASVARIRQYLNNHFSLLIVDECHMQGALRYAQFVSRLNCKYRLGLSATPDRKDGMSRLMREYLGDTVARSTVTAMIPTVELVETSVKPKYNYRTWVYAMKFLAQHKKRERLIVREVFKDLRTDHTIIIPVDFVKHGQGLVDTINRQAEYNNDHKAESWPEETAVFYSNQIRHKEDLKKILGRVDRGRHRVLVAIRSKIKMGIDLNSPTMLYCVVPMSASREKNSSGANIGAPMFYQLSHRISTWVDGKQQPVVKIFVDDLPHSLGCFKSLFWKEIMPGLRRGTGNSTKYKMHDLEFKRAMQIAQAKDDYLSPGKPGQRINSAAILQRQDNSKVTDHRPARGFLDIRRANAI